MTELVHFEQDLVELVFRKFFIGACMRKEIELLGALHIAMSILYCVVFAAIYAVLFSKGFFTAALEGGANIQYVILAVIGGFLLLFAINGVIAAMGTIKGSSWAQMMILILGCLNLICIPLGTALGVYTIWIFMHFEKSGSILMTSSKLSDKSFVSDEQSHTMDMGLPLTGKKAEI